MDLWAAWLCQRLVCSHPLMPALTGVVGKGALLPPWARRLHGATCGITAHRKTVQPCDKRPKTERSEPPAPWQCLTLLLLKADCWADTMQRNQFLAVPAAEAEATHRSLGRAQHSCVPAWVAAPCDLPRMGIWADLPVVPAHIHTTWRLTPGRAACAPGLRYTGNTLLDVRGGLERARNLQLARSTIPPVLAAAHLNLQANMQKTTDDCCAQGIRNDETHTNLHACTHCMPTACVCQQWCSFWVRSIP